MKRIITTLLFIVFFAATLLSTAACSNSAEGENNTSGSLSLVPETYMLYPSDTVVSVSVTTDALWFISDVPAWINTSTMSGKAGTTVVQFEISANLTGAERSYDVTFMVGSNSQSVRIIQRGGAMLTLSKNDFVLTSKESSFAVDVAAADRWTITGGAEWVVPSQTSGLAGSASVTFKVSENGVNDSRTTRFEVRCADATEFITVSQAQQDKITVDASRIELPDSAGSFDVRVAYNIDYTLKINADGQWLTDATSRAVKTDNLTFAYTSNTETTSRQAQILFTSKLGVDTVYVEQGSAAYGANIFGYIKDQNDEPVEGVVVSDGRLTTQTDSRGLYRLHSAKQMGYVFMSVPSGYEAATQSYATAIPLIHTILKEDSLTAERADFALTKIDGGNDNHAIFFWTDSHFINRKRALATLNDQQRFLNYDVPDMQAEASRLGVRVYSVHLGDITWDAYWYTSTATMATVNYDLRTYYYFNRKFPFQIYHCQGNHDNDPKSKGEENCQHEFVQYLAPTYYSFNIGKVHYMVLDNNQYEQFFVADGSREWYYTYKGTSTTQKCQWEWIQNDIKYVPKGTKIVICQHVGVMNMSSYFNTSLSSMDGINEILNTILKDYNVEIVVGHSHVALNLCLNNGSRVIREHRVPATCTVMWHNDYLSGTGLTYDQGQDGSPASYFVLRFDGTKESYYLKPFNNPATVQMALYDMSTFAADDMPSGYTTSQIIANVWSYEEGWTISAAENGKAIAITRFSGSDPWYYRWHKQKMPDDDTYPVGTTRHLFRINPSVSKSTITVTATDRFGNVYTKSITRSE